MGVDVSAIQGGEPAGSLGHTDHRERREAAGHREQARQTGVGRTGLQRAHRWAGGRPAASGSRNGCAAQTGQTVGAGGMGPAPSV